MYSSQQHDNLVNKFRKMPPMLTRPNLAAWVLPLIFMTNLADRMTAWAQPMSFHVRETAGLRRFGYPVTASLGVPEGELRSVDAVVMLDAADRPVPAQFTTMSAWPDGSVKSLDVDFTSSIGPLESATYRVDLKPDAKPVPAAGLSVSETSDEIIVSSSSIRHRIRRDGKPLLSSVAFGNDEFLAADGITTTQKPGAVEILKSGPFNVTIGLGDVRLEYVSSKSWVKITQNAMPATDLAVDAHFVMAETPVVWDFGAGGWLYGSCGTREQTALLRLNSDNWQVFTGKHDEQTLFATGHTVDGWGHMADREHVIAFGVMDFNADRTSNFSITGEGRFRAAVQRKDLTVYFHFVKNPVQVTAVTSPASMLAPLIVTIDGPSAGM
ncbi:MAG: hypothetical protein R3C17_16575 [Planctomycetaceae bacterium]